MFLVFSKTRFREPGAQKVVYCVSAHFCLVKTLPIAKYWGFCFLDGVGWGGVPEFLKIVSLWGGPSWVPKGVSFQGISGPMDPWVPQGPPRVPKPLALPPVLAAFEKADKPLHL